MITQADDLLGHPSADHFPPEDSAPVAAPSVSDTEHAMFTERFWYMGALVPAGDVVFGAGLGYYANRKIMDGYVGVTLDGTQYAFSGSRQCRSDPLTPTIGPMRIEIEEPMRVHRIVLGPNDSPLTVDLRYTSSLPPNDEGRDRVIRRGEMVADVSRFVQLGNYEGWIDIGGRRLQVRRAECWGARDRSWGLRAEARTDESSPPVTRFKPMLFLWVCAQFKDHGIHFFLKEDAPGAVRSFVGDQTFGSGAAAREMVAVEHDLEWQDDPHSQRILRGELRLRFADGKTKLLRLRVLPGWFSLKAGMYGGYEGWFQGDDKGPLHTASRVWSLSDPLARRKLRSLAEQVVEFRDGEEIGFGTIQASVAPGFGRYPEIQGRPFM